MIDDNTKLIFVENIKCASAAIKQILTGNTYHDSFDPRTATMNHDLPERIQQRYPDKWREYRSFVVVRNSWDRALSFFNYYAVLMKAESYQHYDFDSWVEDGLPRPSEDHFQVNLLSKSNSYHFLSQLQYTKDVDCIIRLHSFDPQERATELQESITALSRQWGFTIYPVEKNVNATRTSNEKVLWSNESVARIAELFAEEIAEFGFISPE